MTEKELNTSLVRLLLAEIKEIDSIIKKKEDEIRKMIERKSAVNELMQIEPYRSLIGKELYIGAEAEPINFNLLPKRLRTAFKNLGFITWGDVTHCKDVRLKIRSLGHIGPRTVLQLNIELAQRELKLQDDMSS